MIAFSQKTIPSVLSLLLAVTLHTCVIALLRSDKINIAFLPVTQLITTHIIYEPDAPPQHLGARKKLLLITPRIAPPELPGLQIASPVQIIETPLVKIGARFEGGFDPAIPIHEAPISALNSSTDRIVRLSIQIYEDGSIGEVHVEQGSDSAVIDNFIADYAKQHWRFTAATQDGTPVASWKSIEVALSSRTITVISR